VSSSDGVCQVVHFCSHVHMPADKEREVDRRPRMNGCRFRVLRRHPGLAVPICLGDSEMLQVVILEACVACAERRLGKRLSRFAIGRPMPTQSARLIIVLSSDVVRFAECSRIRMYSTRRANQYGAGAARVAGSVVRWQSETRIKVQPLCDNSKSNIGARRHSTFYAPRPGGSAVLGCSVRGTFRTVARDNNTIGRCSRWREYWRRKRARPRGQEPGDLQLRRTKALTG
jgi:hypothetical protein